MIVSITLYYKRGKYAIKYKITEKMLQLIYAEEFLSNIANIVTSVLTLVEFLKMNLYF